MLPKAPYALCDKCPLKDRPLAKSDGPADAKLAIVSRSPGQYEALNGKVFSGPSGKVLDHLLELQGVNRTDVLATNVVLCQSDGTEPGFGLAVACCAPRLDAELKGTETVIAAGREAAGALLGDGTSVSGSRGYVHFRDSTDDTSFQQRVIVTNNPAVVLRDDGSFPELVRDFRLAINPIPTPQLPKVRWIDDLEEAKLAVEKMVQQLSDTSSIQNQILSCDIEARGTDGNTGLAHTSEIVCAGFSTRPERAVVFGERPLSDARFRLDDLRRLYEIPTVSYLWHNGKYDIKILRTLGINARVDEDTLLLSWVLDERPGDPESGAGGHSLEWLLKDNLGWGKYEPASVKNFKRTGLLPDQRSRIDLYEYNGMDTAGALALFDVFEREAKNDNVWDKPYKSLLLRLSETLTKVELQGNIYDDVQACDILERQVWPTLKAQRHRMRELTEKPKLNPNSPKQLETLFYDEWGIKHNLSRPKVEKKGKRSTDKYVREVIERKEFTFNQQAVHPQTIEQFIEQLSAFKSLDKQRGTYLEGLILKRFPNGRIYTDFKIHGTESGRLSSSNPNMQNITRTKEGLPNIRRCFIPDPGCVFVSADLSQAELRAIAVLSGDAHLQEIYLTTGRSLHKEVARDFYGNDYSYEQYVKAKNINFGVAFWQSAYSFAQLYHMDFKEADKFIKWWWERFPGVWEWTKSIERLVHSDGELQSPFGHKRRFYVIPADESGRLHIVKEGINFLPQNIAGNITLWAMCSIAEKLDWNIAQIRINVHDNIVLNCKRSHVQEVAKLLKSEMEKAPLDAIGWTFPFKAEVSVGETWGTLEELGLE